MTWDVIQQMSMRDAMANGNGGGRTASDMAGMAMGMADGPADGGSDAAEFCRSAGTAAGGPGFFRQYGSPGRRMQILSGMRYKDRGYEILSELRKKTDVRRRMI